MNKFTVGPQGRLSTKKYGITYDHLSTYICLLKEQYRQLTTKETMSVSSPQLREDLLNSIVELETLLNT